jgi:nitrate reductase gamma subunit
MVTTAGLAVAALGLRAEAWLTLLAWVGGLGGALLAVGSLILLWLRATDPRLKPYTAPVDLMNLGLLVVLGVLSVAVALGGMAPVAEAAGRLLRFQPPDLSPLLAAQMAVASLFLLYFPVTRMVHMFSKYFLYHDVRWDDRPRVTGSALDRRLAAALNYGVSWSAEHVRTGKTWAEVATTLPDNAKKGD